MSSGDGMQAIKVVQCVCTSPAEFFLLALVSCTSVTMIIKHFISDKMKDAIIAKLANQAADYFGDAFKQCQYKDTLPKVSYCLH